MASGLTHGAMVTVVYLIVEMQGEALLRLNPLVGSGLISNSRLRWICCGRVAMSARPRP
jgi:hypothetical protein